MASLEASRRRAQLALLASGAEFAFGDAGDCPLPPDRLAALDAASPGVEAVHEDGLTARVFKLRVGDRHIAVKVARSECLVQNDDGRTSFLNELQRHAELRRLRESGVALPGVVAPFYGSLRTGMIVSPWVDGERVDRFDARRIRQPLETGRTLIAHGFFEWDFSPGNLIDDGRQVWLFDFGYMYRFDPLTQFNSAGDGRDCPQFHLAERIETRNAFAWLLALEQRDGLDVALAGFRTIKQAALDAYVDLRARLAERGADTTVIGRLDAITPRWSAALAGDLGALYLQEGWRSHVLDLDDDLQGQTCTPTTLARADWLIATASRAYAALRAGDALFGPDAALSHDALVRRYRDKRTQATAYQLR